MPLYEVTDEELVPFRRISSGSDLYEREIEDLMWDNIEAFTGEALFRVCRQPTLGTGGRPDIVALDRSGRVHVIEIKRDIDRGQLAQCLEYAGWAKGTNLDELAGMFHEGQDEFFSAWTEFTESTAPQLVSNSPRLTLVARDFDDRTAGALDFLTDSNLPISVLRVTVYEDQERRRFVDIDGDHEPEWEITSVSPESATSGRTPVHLKIDGRRVQISDLMDHGLLAAGESLDLASATDGCDVLRDRHRHRWVETWTAGQWCRALRGQRWTWRKLARTTDGPPGKTQMASCSMH